MIREEAQNTDPRLPPTLSMQELGRATPPAIGGRVDKHVRSGLEELIADNLPGWVILDSSGSCGTSSPVSTGMEADHRAHGASEAFYAGFFPPRDFPLLKSEHAAAEGETWCCSG